MTNPAAFAPVTGASSVSGSTTGFADRYSVASTCAADSLAHGAGGPDRVYEVTAPAGGISSTSLATPGWDGAFYVFTDCADPAGTCVGGTSEASAAVSVAAGDKVFVVVDSAGTGALSGDFTLDFTP